LIRRKTVRARTPTVRRPRNGIGAPTGQECGALILVMKRNGDVVVAIMVGRAILNIGHWPCAPLSS
jgi:hypothetical protein